MSGASFFQRLLDHAARLMNPVRTSGGPGKPGLLVSPLAVPFPDILPVEGVEIAIGRAGYYKHLRDCLLYTSPSPRD
jgi:glutamate N-acetyltransferase/amino-acid N-acetyltransferase